MNIKKTEQAMRIIATTRYTLFFIVSLIAIAAFSLQAQAVEIQPVTSPSGIKAYLVENYTSPIITLSFSFNGGTAQDPVGQEGVTNLLTTMLDEGAGDMDGPQFQALSEKIGMELSFGADRDYFSGTLQTLAENSTQAFDMLRLALNEPRFDSPSLERMRQAILKNLKRAKNSPRRIASIAMRKALFDDHPYARSNNGTIDSVTSLTREDMAQILRRIIARDGLVIGVVGAIGKEELGAVIDKVFGSLPQDSQLNQYPRPVLNLVPKLKKSWISSNQLSAWRFPVLNEMTRIFLLPISPIIFWVVAHFLPGFITKCVKKGVSLIQSIPNSPPIPMPPSHWWEPPQTPSGPMTRSS